MSSSTIKPASPPVAPSKGRRVHDALGPSPNNRATCRNCRRKILKGQERVGIQGRITTPRGAEVWRRRYFHGACVTEDTKRKLHLAPGGEGSRKRAKAGSNAVTPEKKPKPKTATHAAESGKSPLNPSARRRLERELRCLRRCFAEVQGCEGEEYKVFPNKSLRELFAKLPRNRAELMRCWGIKGKRCAQYGDSILAVINSALREQRPGSSGNGPHPVRSPGNNRSPTGPTPGRRSKAATIAAFSDDDDDEIETGPSLSVEEIVRRRVREAEARGEVFEIL